MTTKCYEARGGWQCWSFTLNRKFRKAWKCILYNTAQLLYTCMKTRPKDSEDIVLIRLKKDPNLLCLISCSYAIWNKVGWWGSRIECLIINFLKQKSINTVKKETNNRMQKKFSFSALCFIWMFKHFQGKHIILKHPKKQKKMVQKMLIARMLLQHDRILAFVFQYHCFLDYYFIKIA